MRLAALILCHKSPKQVNALIEALDNENIDCFVHVDKKADFSEQITKRENVYVLPDELRVDVRWGRFSMVSATLNLLNYASAHGEYDYFFLISGQDFPICSPDGILSFLKRNEGLNFISVCGSRYNGYPRGNSFDKRTDLYYPSWLLDRTRLRRLLLKAYTAVTGGRSRTLKMFRRRYVGTVKPCFGSQWWCIHSGFAKHILDRVENDTRLTDFFKNVALPDESFFQTVIMNSPFKDTQREFLHYIDWSQGKASPKDLTASDFGSIVNSGKLMTRKINEDYELIAMLEDHIKKNS